MINENNLDNFLRTLDQSVNYWLVRTDGGENFHYFREKKVIAIGYNGLSIKKLEEINRNLQKLSNDLFQAKKEKKSLKGNSHDVAKKNRNYLQEKSKILQKQQNEIKRNAEEYISLNTEGKINPKVALSQLRKFLFGIKKGDIILIPNRNSAKLLFGMVTSDSPYLTTTTPDQECPYEKRHTVDWKGEIPRHKLEADLFKATFRHKAVISLSENSEKFIDRQIHSFYKKNDYYHLVLHIKKQGAISAYTYMSSWTYVLEEAQRFAVHLEQSFDITGVILDTQVASPGHLKLSTKLGTNAVIIGTIITVALCGGEFSYGEEGFSIKTKGYIESYNSFKNQSDNEETHEILNQKVRELEIEKPEDLIETIKAMDDFMNNEE